MGDKRKKKMNNILCMIFGHKSFYQRAHTINADYDFCYRCFDGLGAKAAGRGAAISPIEPSNGDKETK